MAISTDPPFTTSSTTSPSPPQSTKRPSWPLHRYSTSSTNSSPSKTKKDSLDTDPAAEFVGDLNTNNEIPSVETLKQIEDLPILDEDGKSVPFKYLYMGPNVAKRVMVIFIRHFFCGNCQEYVRSLTSSITPSSLTQLPIPTSIVIIGHGSPTLIPQYRTITSCPFPIFADPSKKLYNALGMLRTLNLGPRPEYQRKELFTIMTASVIQGLKNLKGGRFLQGGDYHQVGGEFLFEPMEGVLEAGTPIEEEERRLNGVQVAKGDGGEKRVVWCHRMKNTRDHVEIPELMEVLGLDGEGAGGKHMGRWSKALGERKGTGLSSRSGLNAEK